jgi:hypothetical protein
MRHGFCLFAALVIAFPSPVADTKPLSLFDGKTLTGWEGDTE